ncbi:putative amidohydrolase [Sphingomonas sp. PP-CE-3G-477]|uniref:carbon-nitrogen hydrolase family protein n=1 Tax=Sphingomonas sp. PP-CE-3G-477 TaxID=2135660 RepID=UPI000D35E7EC|nr:carbon-nitrogen hydrolase family protein [Sphingomonas sp. PP-CE-3G-477]PTQ64225.1 putative amidohydrolase [Sphingomonas sp. PP-CE-3G-477]
MRIAAFQRLRVEDDAAAVVARVVDDLTRADMRMDLAVFPECHLLGHSYDPTTIAARAIDVEDDRWRAILAALAPVATTVILGSFERRADGVTNSAFVIERGRVVGRYAKRHPNEPGVVAGRASPVFERDGVRYGINICNDANHPDAARSLADQGAAVICYPLDNMLSPDTAARWRSRSVENLRARAVQTGCWIVSADVTGSCGARLSHGCTMIVRPDGTIAARVAEGVEGVAIYDVP